MNWSAEQQRLLGELGHDLMVHGTQWPVVAGAARVGAAPTVSVSSRAHDKLVEALRRAAGGKDVTGLVQDIETLRNQPALKRALWPRLRALRRSH